MIKSACGAIILSTLLLTGCSEPFWTSNVRETMRVERGTAIATNADVRLVHRFQGYEPHPVDRVRDGMPPVREIEYAPRDFLCAEPSPDVARVAQAALTQSTDLSGKVAPGGSGTAVEGQLALQLAATRSEGLAQLTRRISSVQLLRDGLYRACEAYANGAITKEGYTAIVSRYDRMMITMLLAEMAAGNFGTVVTLTGQSTAGPSSDSAAAAAQRVTAAQDAAASAQADLAKARNDEADAAKANDTAQANLKTALAAGQSATDQQTAATSATTALTNARKTVGEKQAAYDTAKQQLRQAQIAQKLAAGAATTVSQAGVGGGPASPQAQVADVLLKMLRSYLHEPHGGSIALMCLTEAAEPQDMRRALRGYCEQYFNHLYDDKAMQKLVYDSTAGAELREYENEDPARLPPSLKK